MGNRILLVDVDAQESLTTSLDYNRPDQIQGALAVILGRMISDEPVSSSGGIIYHVEGVDLIPDNIELSRLQVTLVNTMSHKTILRDYLNSVRNQYDVILLDYCPSLDMLAINVLTAAGKVLIPMMAHYLSIKGLEQLIHTLSNVKRKNKSRYENRWHLNHYPVDRQCLRGSRWRPEPASCCGRIVFTFRIILFLYIRFGNSCLPNCCQVFLTKPFSERH